MEDEKVQQLAKTLKEQGLAVSMYEAIEKAKSIMNVQSQKQEPVPENIDEPAEMAAADLAEETAPSVPIEDDTRTVNELMGEAGVDQQEVKQQEREHVEHIHRQITDIKEELHGNPTDPDAVKHLQEKLEQVNNHVSTMVEAKQGDTPQSPQPEAEQPPSEVQPEQREPQHAPEPADQPEPHREETKSNEDEPERKVDLTKMFHFGKK